MSVTDVHRGTSAALDAAPEGRTDRRYVAHLGTAIHLGERYPVHLGHPALRTADGHHRDERRASWLELFFDLAFAGAVGQLAGAFQRSPSLHALGIFLILFTPIWWLWVQLTFYSDRHETKDAAHRISILAAILLCVGLAASAPRALAGQSAGFAIAFVCLRGLQLLLYARARRHLPATRPLYSCYLTWFGAGGALWLASIAVGGSARYAFWGVALITDAVGSLAMLTPRRRLPLNNAHLADRFQIFVLIVLGESMARLISAAAARPWSLPLAVVLTAALITLAALWWAWLTAADPSALDSPVAIARFTALNLPLVAGIAAGSAGLHIAILAADGAHTIGVGPRAALYGGVSICLLASGLLPSDKMTRSARVIRLATAVAAMGLVFMGAIVEPVYLVPALGAVLALGLIAEARLRTPGDDLETRLAGEESAVPVLVTAPPVISSADIDLGRRYSSGPPTLSKPGVGSSHDRPSVRHDPAGAGR